MLFRAIRRHRLLAQKPTSQLNALTAAYYMARTELVKVPRSTGVNSPRQAVVERVRWKVKFLIEAEVLLLLSQYSSRES